MPLIMDDDQYMEDLFNDSEPINIPAATPSVKGLAQRLDELEETGCCQKIAWSRSGCVATITRDGRGVNLRAFQRSSTDGKWILGEECPLQIPPVHDDFPLVHVSWGHLGVDLAILDAAGRVLIFTNNFALDRMHMTRDNVMDQEIETGTVVGLHWLPVFPQQAKCRMLWAASRKDDNWHYAMTGHQMRGPHNPIEPRAAIICLTRNGTIRLLHQQADSLWNDAVAEVEAINSAKATFTHASFAPDKDDALLLTAHDLSGSLHVYRVRIHWNVSKGQPGQPPMTSPVLEVSALKTENNCSPLGSSLDGDAMDIAPQVSYAAQLTHLTFVPTAPESRPHEASSPMILAIFSHTPAAIPSLVGQASTQQPPFSILARWELSDSRAGLHAGFDQLSAKKKSPSSVESRPKLTLRRLPDVMLNSVTTNFYSLDYHTKFCLCQSDGRVEFRRRDTLEVIAADYNSDQVTSLVQAGFTFPSSESALHVALSPSFCVAAIVQNDGSITLKNMEYGLGSLSNSEEDPKATAAVIAITLQHSSASLQYCCTDDLLSIMPADMNASLKETFLSGLYNSMNIATDFTPEADAQTLMQKIFNNNVARGCLSAQSLLGILSPGHQDLPGKLAWATLNLRLTVLAIAMNSVSMRTKPEAFKAETAKSLTGIIKYTLDTTVYIVDELLELSHALKTHHQNHPPNHSSTPDPHFIQSYISTHRSPALLLVLCSYPRALLRMTSRPLSHLFNLTKTVLPHAPSVTARAMYNGLMVTVASSPVQPPHMVAIINDVDAGVRAAYAAAGYDDEKRRAVERDMLVSARVPDVLAPVVTRLLGREGGLGKVREHANVAGVMFWDLRWLGLGEGARERKWWEDSTVDVLRKVVLVRGDKRKCEGAGGPSSADTETRSGSEVGVGLGTVAGARRRCARCASVMEDKEGRGEAWMGSFHKACACGSSWVLEGKRV